MVMVEVFRTNVKDVEQSKMLSYQISRSFCDYSVNFDLDDCDKILRIQSIDSQVDVDGVIEILKDFGFRAEVLPDEVPHHDSIVSAMIRQCKNFYFYQPDHQQ